jgi:hypothetical protein
MFKVVGFPPEVLETARQVFESGTADLSKAAAGAAH